MENQSLAMASVPVQKWGPVYEEGEALQAGTIFRELDLPFYAAEEIRLPGREQEIDERDGLLRRICQTGFMLDDLTLYLDTHEEDPEAAALYREKTKEKKELMKQFAEQFYPLNRNFAACCGRESGSFCWQMGPAPWEGGVDHVVL